MALSWSARRQLLYYAVATVFFIVLAVVLQQGFFSKAPTCFDAIQNGGEAGVDCGGSCALVCKETARPPTVLWARAFPAGENRYSAVAYVQNQNPGAGSRKARYSFKLYDQTGLLVIEKEGTTDLPPITTIPIVEPNIDVGNRTVARALFQFTSLQPWYKISAGENPIPQVTRYELSEENSRLTATVENNSLQDVTNVTVVAVLFDAAGAAQAASRSLIATIERKSSQTVIFTWPTVHPDVVRAEVTVLPSL